MQFRYVPQGAGHCSSMRWELATEGCMGTRGWRVIMMKPGLVRDAIFADLITVAQIILRNLLMPPLLRHA